MEQKKELGTTHAGGPTAQSEQARETLRDAVKGIEKRLNRLSDKSGYAVTTICQKAIRHPFWVRFAYRRVQTLIEDIERIDAWIDDNGNLKNPRPARKRKHQNSRSAREGV